mmetsp:Transcript_72970/g.193845  ORF Transcript_72970/g.193845 Transcript_72970/m.193845 type:complete len:207 (-) Transcript_72970:135-755(-)
MPSSATRNALHVCHLPLVLKDVGEVVDVFVEPVRVPDLEDHITDDHSERVVAVERVQDPRQSLVLDLLKPLRLQSDVARRRLEAEGLLDTHPVERLDGGAPNRVGHSEHVAGVHLEVDSEGEELVGPLRIEQSVAFGAVANLPGCGRAGEVTAPVEVLALGRNITPLSPLTGHEPLLDAVVSAKLREEVLTHLFLEVGTLLMHWEE